MSLLVLLYKDSKVMENQPKLLAPLSSRAFNFCGNPDFYDNFNPTTNLEKSHIKKVLTHYEKPRSYDSIYDIKMDSHIELEKAGLSKDAKKYRVVVTLEDSLDFVLSKLINVKLSTLQNDIKDYQTISRGILNQDWDLLGNHGFGFLIGISEEFDRYLENLLKSHNTVRQALYTLFKDILKLSHSMISYLAIFLKYHYGEQGITLTVKSRSASSVVLTSNTRIEETLLIDSMYEIYVKSYAMNEYINHINENTSGGFLWY